MERSTKHRNGADSLGAASEGQGQDVGGATTLDLGGLAGRLGFHLRLAHVAMWRDFTARLSELELTQRRTGVLEVIAANPGVSQVDLAATFGTDRATMMAIVDKLEARGLIDRRRSAGDRRRQELRVTEKGVQLLKRALQIVAIHEDDFRSRFSDAELAALIVALKRIHGRG